MALWNEKIEWSKEVRGEEDGKKMVKTEMKKV